MMEKIKLTQFSRSSGCGCKISPTVLEKILKTNETTIAYPKLLVGNQERDDAAVVELDIGTALISTTDFFMPLVDDAFDFGRIASANAISDVYAMGGTPLVAIAILGWPVDKIDTDLAAQVLEGSRKVCAEAGIPLAGGHSVDSLEPIFGLSVNGIVPLSQIKRNNTAKEGDSLFLTKPIGTGIMGTAFKRGLLSQEDYINWLNSMCSLNTIGVEFGKLGCVNAMTDVTGFGLIGHLMEMCEGSNVSVELDYNAVPLLPGLDVYTKQFCFPDNTTRNLNAYKNQVEGMDGLEFISLCDPQTSGGLLVSVSPDGIEKFVDVLTKNNLTLALKPIGRVTKRKDKMISVV